MGVCRIGQEGLHRVWSRVTYFVYSVGYRLNDGYWHTVDLAARDNLLTLTIDEEEGSPLKITNPFTIKTGDRYFFGGGPMTSVGGIA